jgi:DNA-binding transcriptional ArsR family regulator
MCFKMRGRHLLWAVLPIILLPIPSILAQDTSRILRVEANIRILSDFYSEEEIRLTYVAVSGSILGDEFRIPGEISQLEVRDPEGRIEFSKRGTENLTVVRFFFRNALRPGRKYDVTLTYRSSNFTYKAGNLWGYSTILLAGSSVDQWSLVLEIPGEVDLHLPEGEALEGLRRIHREDGRTFCEWTASDTDSLAVAMGYSPVEAARRSRLVLYLSIAGVILVAALAGYLLHGLAPERGKEMPKAAELAVKLLEDRERRIIRELSGGQKLTQAELVKATKLSKATVSRAVVELERRRIVDRERSGRVIRVKLQDWILET